MRIRWWGWSIGGTIVAAVALSTPVLIGLIGTTPPTALGKNPAFVEPIQLPVGPETILLSDPSKDATEPYRLALADYQKNPRDYEEFGTGLGAAPAGIEQLLLAANAGKAKLFEDDPAKIVNYTLQKPNLDALVELGRTANRAALLRARDDPKQSRKYFESAFALGQKLFAERLNYAELSAGLGLMNEAATGMRYLAQNNPDSALEHHLTAFLDASRQYNEQHLLPTWRILSTIDPKIIGQHAGDVFLLAKQSRERMWRTEAILALGRARFNAGRAGDQRQANRYLQQLQADPHLDPVLRTAVNAAKNLTAEQYRGLQ